MSHSRLNVLYAINVHNNISVNDHPGTRTDAVQRDRCVAIHLRSVSPRPMCMGLCLGRKFIRLRFLPSARHRKHRSMHKLLPRSMRLRTGVLHCVSSQRPRDQWAVRGNPMPMQSVPRMHEHRRIVKHDHRESVH
jgi:hypothetical protein